MDMNKGVTRKRLIVHTGTDRYETHRGDFTTCPNCGHVMEIDKWDKSATTLVLHPRCYKNGCVAIISECPKCFEPSWVHYHMQSFEWNERWPKPWREAVVNLEAATKLTALRDWGASICHRCKHLSEGKVDYHAWRTCIIGTGPAERECNRFEPFQSKL